MTINKTNTNGKAVEDIISRYKDHEIDPKQHFRFGKLECYELAKVRSTRHAKYNINYQLSTAKKYYTGKMVFKSLPLHKSVANKIY